MSLDCRDRLAMSGNHGNYTECKKVDFGNQWPICELRDPDDVSVLSANGGISGTMQVRKNLEPETMLKPKPYQ